MGVREADCLCQKLGGKMLLDQIICQWYQAGGLCSYNLESKESKLLALPIAGNRKCCQRHPTDPGNVYRPLDIQESCRSQVTLSRARLRAPPMWWSEERTWSCEHFTMWVCITLPIHFSSLFNLLIHGKLKDQSQPSTRRISHTWADLLYN